MYEIGGLPKAKNWLCAMRHSAESIFVIEYLCKYDFIFEMTLAPESETQGYWMMKKSKGKKSRDIVPLIFNFLNF
jgi:hypothetical protein